MGILRKGKEKERLAKRGSDLVAASKTRKLLLLLRAKVHKMARIASVRYVVGTRTPSCAKRDSGKVFV